MVSDQTISLLRPQLDLISSAYDRFHEAGVNAGALSRYARDVWDAMTPLTRSALLDLRKCPVNELMTVAVRLKQLTNAEAPDAFGALRLYEALAILAAALPIVENLAMEEAHG